MEVFNLIPTEPLEYQVYADYLEDQDNSLTSSIRKGILPLDAEDGKGYGQGSNYGDGGGIMSLFEAINPNCIFLGTGKAFGSGEGDSHGYGDHDISDYFEEGDGSWSE